MDRTFNRVLVIGMGLIVLLLIANAWLGYHITRQLNEAVAWVAHTQEVMDALEEVASTMKDAQTGQRGFIITGETRYLEPYDSATAGIDEKVQRLQLLTAAGYARLHRLRQDGLRLGSFGFRGLERDMARPQARGANVGASKGMSITGIEGPVT